MRVPENSYHALFGHKPRDGAGSSLNRSGFGARVRSLLVPDTVVTGTELDAGLLGDEERSAAAHSAMSEAEHQVQAMSKQILDGPCKMLDVAPFTTAETAKSTRAYAESYVKAHRALAEKADAYATKQREYVTDHKPVLSEQKEAAASIQDSHTKLLAADATRILSDAIAGAEKVATHNKVLARMHRIHASILDGYARTVAKEVADGSGDTHLIQASTSKLMKKLVAKEIDNEQAGMQPADASMAYASFNHVGGRELVDTLRKDNVQMKATGGAISGVAATGIVATSVVMPALGLPMAALFAAGACFATKADRAKLVINQAYRQPLAHISEAST